MQTFNANGRTILVNDTGEDIYLPEDGTNRRKLESVIHALVNIERPLRRALENQSVTKYDSEKVKDETWASKVSDAHARNQVLLTPAHFTSGDENFVTTDVALQFLASSSFGQSLQSELIVKGLEGFMDDMGPVNQILYKRNLQRILASLTMAIHGIDNVKELPAEAFLAWITYFRTPEGTRWREKEWANFGPPFKCLRELTFAFSRLIGRDDLGLQISQKRSDSTRSYYWADIMSSPAPHIAPWLKLFLAWRGEDPTLAANHRSMFQHLVSWFDGNFQSDQVEDVVGFLAARERPVTFTAYMTARREADQTVDQGNGFLAVLGSAKRFSEYIAHDLEIKGEARIVFHLVTERETASGINILKREGNDGFSGEAKSRPLPMRLYRLTRQILSEGELGWPGEGNICKVDIVTAQGKTEKIYCPVLPTLFLSLFHLPLRVGQMKRLDSGEGDTERFDGITLKWNKNTGPNAGYWRKIRKGMDQRGYAYSFGSTPAVTGFFINTNKTGAPYRVPWQNAELHRLFYDLRVWQETWNPAAGPIAPELYVDNAEGADEGKLSDYPDIFSLFRIPLDLRSARQNAPPNARRTGEFWQRLMAEVERRWNQEHPTDTIQIVSRQKDTGQAYGAIYNAHGMRVAGLTWMVEQGVPLEIISKLIAGHKTLLMTLYYIKFDPAKIRDMLGEVLQNQSADTVADTLDELRSADFSAAQRRTACVEPDGLLAAITMHPTEKTFWADTGIGLCPWDGTRCHDGGKLLRKEETAKGKNKNIHAAVEGGDRNCVMCRHFITGPAWMMPLWLYASKLLRQIAVKAARATQLGDEIEALDLRAESASGINQNRLRKDIAMRTVELNGVSADQEVSGKAIWSTKRLLERCVAIAMESGGEGAEQSDGQAFVVQERSSVVDFLELTNFQQAAIITAASRVYPIIHDEEAEAACEHFLDHIVGKSGGMPLSFAPLDPEAKRRGFDALSRLVLERVKKEEMLALTEGAMTLQDLNLDKAAASVLSSAIGKPMKFPSLARDASLTITDGQP